MIGIEGIIRTVGRIAPGDVRVRRRLATLLFLRACDKHILVLDASRVWLLGHACDAEFREEDHERDGNGRFTSGNGNAAPKDITDLLGEEIKGVKGRKAVRHLPYDHGKRGNQG